MIVQLNECPFCDSDQLDLKYYDPSDGYQGNLWRYQVCCKCCGATLERKTLKEVEDAWNTRSWRLPAIRGTLDADPSAPLSPSQRSLIIMLTRGNMNISYVCRKLKVSRSKVETSLRQVKQNTGLNPFDFFDLYKLFKIATSGVSK